MLFTALKFDQLRYLLSTISFWDTVRTDIIKIYYKNLIKTLNEQFIMVCFSLNVFLFMFEL